MIRLIRDVGLLSCGLAGAVLTASGGPLASTKIMIFTPFPALVLGAADTHATGFGFGKGSTSKV